MSLGAIAERVQKGDPDRYLATMAVPPALRSDFLTLYALNLEAARAGSARCACNGGAI